MTNVSAHAISNALHIAKHIQDGSYIGRRRSEIGYNDVQRTQYDMLIGGLRNVKYKGYLGIPALDVRKDVLVGGIVKPLGKFLRNEGQKDDQHYGILIVVKNEKDAQSLEEEWVRKKMFSDSDVAIYSALGQTQYTQRKALADKKDVVDEDEKPLEFRLPQDTDAPATLAPQFNKQQLILTQQAFVSLADRGLISPQSHPIVLLYDGDKIKGKETEAALQEFMQTGHVVSFGGTEQKMLFDLPEQRKPSVAGQAQTRKPKRMNSAQAPFLTAFAALFGKEPLSTLDAGQIVERIKDRVTPDAQNVSAVQVVQWREGTHIPTNEKHIRVIAKLAGLEEEKTEQLMEQWTTAKKAQAVVQESRVRKVASGKANPSASSGAESDNAPSPSPNAPADTVRTPAELRFLKTMAYILEEAPPFAGRDGAGVVALLHEADPTLNITEAQVAQWREQRGDLPEDERFGKVVDDIIKQHRLAQDAVAAQGNKEEVISASPPVSENPIPATIASGNGINGHRLTGFERKFSVVLTQGKFRRTNDAQAAHIINDALPANVERVTGELVRAWRERSGGLPIQEVVTAFVQAASLYENDKKTLKALWNNDHRLPCDAERFALESRGHRADAVRERRSGGHEVWR